MKPLAEAKLFDGLVRIWATCDRLRNGCCEVCAAKIKISEKDLKKSFEVTEFYPSIEYFVKRYLVVKRLKADLDGRRLKTLTDFAERIKNDLAFPAKPYGAYVAGNYYIKVECPKCREPYMVNVNFRVDEIVFKPIASWVSWYDVIKAIPESGSDFIDYRLRKYLHGDYREIREKVFEEVSAKRFGLLYELVERLKELLGIKVDFWCPPALENRPQFK